MTPMTPNGVMGVMESWELCGSYHSLRDSRITFLVKYPYRNKYVVCKHAQRSAYIIGVCYFYRSTVLCASVFVRVARRTLLNRPVHLWMKLVRNIPRLD